jgi:hypothetical protein
VVSLAAANFDNFQAGWRFSLCSAVEDGFADFGDSLLLGSLAQNAFGAGKGKRHDELLELARLT